MLYPDSGRLLQTLAPILTPLLLSEDYALRENSLRILSHLKQTRLPTNDEHVNSEDVNLFASCLEVEEAGMSLQNVRERTTKIRKIGIVLRPLVFDEEHMWLLKAVITFLCSEFSLSSRERSRWYIVG